MRDGETSSKNWICLFTCLNVRAIHLELVENMLTESFLLCIRRFIACRGTPKMIISDNANQFKLGNKIIQKLWKNVTKNIDVKSYIADSGIIWKYTVEYAPWKGGFYERLIGITKRSLRKSFGKSTLNRIELVTLLTETEGTINRRPLLYVSDDINSSQVITPAHFTIINHKTGAPDVEEEFYPEQNLSETLLGTWKRGQYYLNQFWEIWLSEYMPALRERGAFQMKPTRGEVNRKPNRGEIVIVKEERFTTWKLEIS